MGKTGRPQPRHPARERVVGVTLVYINIVVVLFVLAAFISIDPSPAIIEDLSWGYLDDHQFQGNDTVYINWCNRFFEPQACTAPIKMSGYFALRSARVTYRVSGPVPVTWCCDVMQLGSSDSDLTDSNHCPAA